MAVNRDDNYFATVHIVLYKLKATCLENQMYKLHHCTMRFSFCKQIILSIRRNFMSSLHAMSCCRAQINICIIRSWACICTYNNETYSWNIQCSKASWSVSITGVLKRKDTFFWECVQYNKYTVKTEEIPHCQKQPVWGSMHSETITWRVWLHVMTA